MHFSFMDDDRKSISYWRQRKADQNEKKKIEGEKHSG